MLPAAFPIHQLRGLVVIMAEGMVTVVVIFGHWAGAGDARQYNLSLGSILLLPVEAGVAELTFLRWELEIAEGDAVAA